MSHTKPKNRWVPCACFRLVKLHLKCAHYRTDKLIFHKISNILYCAHNLKIGGFSVLVFEVNLIQTFWFVKLYESQMYRTDKMIFHANLHSFTQCFTFSESALKHRNAEKYESCSSYSRPSALFGFKIESYCLYFRGMTLIFIKTANLSLFFFLVSHPRFNI